MVVQSLILPVGFGRFFPRWQMIRKRTLHARVDVRERPTASDRGVEPRHTSTVNPSCVNFSETDLRMRQVH